MGQHPIEYRFTNFEYQNQEPHFEIPNGYKPQASVARIESILNKLKMIQVPTVWKPTTRRSRILTST